MVQSEDIRALAERFLAELGKIGYSDQTMAECRGACRRLVEFAEGRGESVFTEALAVDYINARHAVGLEGLYQRPVPGSEHAKLVTRCMRRMLEFQRGGGISPRMPGALEMAALPPGLQALLDSFAEAGRRGGYSEVTVGGKSGVVKRFLLFLADRGGSDASCLDASSAHDYIVTKAGNRPRSIKRDLGVIRSFYGHVYLEGLVGRDLRPAVPNPKLYCAPSLPVVWADRDVEKLLDGVDRGSPIGKRDYAMLLMVARLGLRASDVKAVRVDSFDWAARKISIIQHKTGVPLDLPLLDDVGWAVIDYLRNGRPEGASCPEVFVRHVVPYGPMPGTSSISHILVNRAREAGVDVSKGGRGSVHSLRHALATRLLEQRVPVEDISRVLGHADARSTSAYLHMDLRGIAECALDPEGASS